MEAGDKKMKVDGLFIYTTFEGFFHLKMQQYALGKSAQPGFFHIECEAKHQSLCCVVVPCSINRCKALY